MGRIFWQFDFPSLLIASLSVFGCSLVGNFLIIRKQGLVSDAISHIALPGIVGGYLVTGVLSGWAMMIGAGVASLIAIVLLELIRNTARLEPGATLGVVFSGMFAIGVLMLELSTARSVHLDVEHALSGNLESAIWLSGSGFSDLFDWTKLKDLPPTTGLLIAVNAVILAVILAFYKELVLSSFDEQYASSIGLPVATINFSLMLLTAAATVAAFNAVGSILVIAMFICPPATARLLTDHLASQIALSTVFAVVSAILGYFLAIWLPLLWNSSSSISSAGMVALTAGLFQLIAMVATKKPFAKLRASTRTSKMQITRPVS